MRLTASKGVWEPTKKTVCVSTAWEDNEKISIFQLESRPADEKMPGTKDVKYRLRRLRNWPRRKRSQIIKTLDARAWAL